MVLDGDGGLGKHRGATGGVHGVADMAALGLLPEDPRLLDAPGVPVLAKLRRRLANPGLVSTAFAFVGDTTFEGYNQPEVDTLQALLGPLLHTWYAPGNQSEGFIPARHTTTSAMAQRFTFTGSPDTTDHGYGWPRRSVILHAGDTASITVACTNPKLVYSKDAGLGTISATVDGGAATTAATAGTRASGFQLSLGTLAAGNHAIVVSNGGGGDVVLDGVYPTNGSDLGPKMWNGGNANITAALLVADQTWITALAQMDAGVIVLCIAADAFLGGSSALYEVNLRTIVAAIQATSPFSCVVLCVPWPSQGTSNATWQPWADAVRRVARFAGCGVVDFWSAIGTPDGSFSWTDTVHANRAGDEVLTYHFFRQVVGVDPPVGGGLLADTWHAVGYTNGWSDFGAPYAGVQYRWSADGRQVLFRGAMKGAAIGVDAFPLPGGYRPIAPKIIDVNSNNAFGSVLVNTTGATRCYVGSPAFVSLDGKSFDLDP